MVLSTIFDAMIYPFEELVGTPIVSVFFTDDVVDLDFKGVIFLPEI